MSPKFIDTLKQAVLMYADNPEINIEWILTGQFNSFVKETQRIITQDRGFGCQILGNAFLELLIQENQYKKKLDALENKLNQGYYYREILGFTKWAREKMSEFMVRYFPTQMLDHDETRKLIRDSLPEKNLWRRRIEARWAKSMSNAISISNPYHIENLLKPNERIDHPFYGEGSWLKVGKSANVDFIEMLDENILKLRIEKTISNYGLIAKAHGIKIHEDTIGDFFSRDLKKKRK